MNIKKVVSMLNSLSSYDVFYDDKKFYDLVKNIIELTNINTKFSSKDDDIYKDKLCIRLAREVSSNLKQDDKKAFYDMIDSEYLKYCNDLELILEQIQIRKISISKLSIWEGQDELKEFILNRGEINKTPIKTDDIFKLIVSLDDDVKKKEFIQLHKERFVSDNIKFLRSAIYDFENSDIRLELYRDLTDEEFEELETLRGNQEEFDIVLLERKELNINERINIINGFDIEKNKILGIDIIMSLEPSSFEIIKSKFPELAMKSDEYILAALDKDDIDIREKMNRIKTLKTEDNQMRGINNIVANDPDKLVYVRNEIQAIAEGFQIVENKVKMLSLVPYFENGYEAENMDELNKRNIQLYKSNIIKSFNNDDKKMKYIGEIDDSDLRYSIILSLEDGKKKIEELIKNGFFEIFINDRYRIEESNSLIKENIDQVLMYYGYIDNMEEKKSLLSRMEKDNAKLYTTINFKLLEDRYVQTFSETQLNIIASLWKEQTALFKLDDNQLKLCSILLQNQKEDDFREFYSNIVGNIESYRKLSSNIEFSQLKKDNIELLSKIMQYHNDFDIETLDDLSNFEQKKNKKLNDLAKSSDPKQIISAIIWKQFGIDYATAEKLSIEFSNEENDEKIDKFKALINYAKEKDLGSELLKNIYNSVTQENGIVDKINIRKKYKSKYEKEISSTLLKIDDLPQKELEDGTIVYDAGTDFSMLITAISPYVNNEDSENSKENWNRKDLGSEHFCASYIRNDMLGVCSSTEGIYYAFCEIPNESLMYMDYQDLQSSSYPLLHSSANGTRTFINTDDLINKAGTGNRHDYYNELDIKRRTNGNRIQPNYLVVFKNGDKYENLAKTIKASKEWGGLPIVVIDIDKCLEKQIEELNQISENYTLTPDNELLENIWIKFHNMSITILKWKANPEKIVEKVKIPNVLRENIMFEIGFHHHYSLKNIIFKETTKKSPQEIIEDLKKAYSIDDKEIDIQEGDEKKDEGLEEKTLEQTEKKDEINNEEIKSEAEMINEVEETNLVDEAKYADNYYKTRNKTDLISRVTKTIKACINKMMGKDEQNTH